MGEAVRLAREATGNLRVASVRPCHPEFIFNESLTQDTSVASHVDRRVAM